MRLIDFQYSAHSRYSRPADINRRYYHIVELVRVALSRAKIDAPFRKLVIALHPDSHHAVGEAFLLIQILECHAIAPESALWGSSYSQFRDTLLQATRSALDDVYRATGWEGGRDLILSAIGSSSGSCVYVSQSLSRRVPRRGPLAEVTIAIGENSSQLRVVLKKNGNVLSEQVVCWYADPVGLDVSFPVASTSVDGDSLVFLDHSKKELARVTFPTFAT